mmetsp:Transcript_10809/g.23882  ORF Transcript_10809/g.23882 Transcript_10809/m.23882 type:complete len:98 (-) Transcript_10809:484-777(-)
MAYSTALVPIPDTASTTCMTPFLLTTIEHSAAHRVGKRACSICGTSTVKSISVDLELGTPQQFFGDVREHTRPDDATTFQLIHAKPLPPTRLGVCLF